MTEGRDKLEEILKSLSITTTVFEHPEVFTVEAMMPHLQDCKGLIVKNLFLKGKKKKDLWLITVGHDKEINLTQLGKDLSVPGGFRFADEAILEEKLGVKQGCVTPLALMNDKNHDVKLVLDKDIQHLSESELIYSHPIVNSATMGMSYPDFSKFLEHTGHKPNFIELSKAGAK
ncbi:prolyl-tRNA synthetase associated domain-containing protein 1-like [Styela clava]